MYIILAAHLLFCISNNQNEYKILTTERASMQCTAFVLYHLSVDQCPFADGVHVEYHAILCNILIVVHDPPKRII